MGTHTIFLSHCAIDELKAPAYAEAPAGRPASAKAPAGKPGYYAKVSVGRQSSKKTLTPAWPARCAVERSVGDDIYPVRNNVLLFCSPAGGGITF